MVQRSALLQISAKVGLCRLATGAPDFTADSVLQVWHEKKEAGWADPPEASEVPDLRGRLSYEGPIVFEESSGRPRNPRGRTGMPGRGLLGNWGPNHAADPIVTRWAPHDRTKLQMVVIERKDTGEWAIPGGMVDPGEMVSATLRREFTEEAGNVPPAKRQRFEALMEQLFAPKNSKVIYRGYVDDPRNTDNAWMETTTFHFHCNDTLACRLPLPAGDDAGNVMWLDVDPSNPKFFNLYASHREWVEEAARQVETNARVQVCCGLEHMLTHVLTA